jgi:hypothetical protein
MTGRAGRDGRWRDRGLTIGKACQTCLAKARHRISAFDSICQQRVQRHADAPRCAGDGIKGAGTASRIVSIDPDLRFRDSAF